jgi:hypothetical protein
LTSDVDLNLLFVEYDQRRITVEQLLDAVRSQGFTAEIQE